MILRTWGLRGPLAEAMENEASYNCYPVPRRSWCHIHEETQRPGRAFDLAAYQTCRAGVALARTALRWPDTGRPPGLCTLARSAGVALRILARQSPRRTETVVVVTVRRHIVVTEGRADVSTLERGTSRHATHGYFGYLYLRYPLYLLLSPHLYPVDNSRISPDTR